MRPYMVKVSELLAEGGNFVFLAMPTATVA